LAGFLPIAKAINVNSILIFGKKGTAPLLPQWLSLNPADKVSVIYEVIYECVPGFCGYARGLGHVFQFIDPAIGQGTDHGIGAGVHADDMAVG
jgi:hypothetical protein